MESDHQAVVERQERWDNWTDSTELRRERQRRHRLKNIRPRELARPGSDPLLLAAECLEHLRLVRRALGAHPRAPGHLDEAIELVKQLGAGPQSLPKAERKITPGRIGMHNRWHVKEGKPCNCKWGVGPRTSP